MKCHCLFVNCTVCAKVTFLSSVKFQDLTPIECLDQLVIIMVILQSIPLRLSQRTVLILFSTVCTLVSLSAQGFSTFFLFHFLKVSLHFWLPFICSKVSPDCRLFLFNPTQFVNCPLHVYCQIKTWRETIVINEHNQEWRETQKRKKQMYTINSDCNLYCNSKLMTPIQ